jgi:membrane-associated phospholipid phosphatase
LKKTLFHFFLLFLYISVNAQDPLTIDSVRTNKKIMSMTAHDYFFLLGDDFKKQATAPLKMKKKQFLHFGEFALITSGLLLSDAYIDKHANSIRDVNPFVKKTSPVITQLGGSYGIYTIGLVELYGLVFNDKKARVTALLASQSFITSSVWTWVGKLTAGRERPSAAYGNSRKPSGEWHGLFQSFQYIKENETIPGSSYDAFPSGHTATVFSIATVYAKMYNGNLSVPIVAYSIASLVGLSRLTEQTHWMSDVFVGAALGYLCGSQVVSNYRNSILYTTKKRKKKNIAISMDYYHHNFSAGINYKL